MASEVNASTEMLIKLNNTSADATVVTKNNNISTTKVISIESLITSLTGGHKISTGILPKGTKFFSGSLSDYIIGIEIPRCIRPLRYVRDGVFEYNIPFPMCFVVFYVIDGRISNTYVYALKNPVTSKSTELFNFPFGNTYGDGRVCWGGVRLSEVKSPTELLSTISLFFGSEYNGDLISSSSFDESVELNITMGVVKTLLDALNGKEFFPNELLYKSIKNLKNIID